jgi:predicted AlkP superfamily pyrophosphatase or phosphodiesterase
MVPKKVVLVVIDGLTPAVFEHAVETRSAPMLAALADHGTYGRAVSVFPSLTPVCLSAIATGGGPDVHRIPHLVWYHREERRIVEYGSSFGAVRAAGIARSLLDTIYNMNAEHLGADAVTVFESLADAGFVDGAVNLTCYRGRTRHEPTLPWVRAAMGPRRFFYYSLFESDRTGAPIAAAVRNRAGGSIDSYATYVGRWLVTRDGFDFLAYYLADYDYASHTFGPEESAHALERSDAAVAGLVEAAGGLDAFLERYAVVLCSDHGQTTVHEGVRLQDSFADLAGETLVTASNRAGMVYRLPECGPEAAELAMRLDGAPHVEVSLRREDAEAVARREGEELRFRPAAGGWETSGDASILDHPNALERCWSALANPNAGELLVSAAEGYEFADLAGRHHAGGGSHGSLVAGDSFVPMLAVGLDAAPARITDVAPAVLRHFGVEPPAYARPLAHVA